MRSSIISSLIIGIALLHSTVYALPTQDNKIDSVLYNDIVLGFDDVKYIGQEITSTTSESLFSAGILLGTSLALMPYDEEMRTTALRNKAAMDGTAISIANEYGNLLYPAFGMMATYGYGLAFKDESVRTFARKTTTSLLIAGGITTILKSVLGRSRPFMNEGNGQFSPCTLDDSRLSFPSGHSTVAFVMSASLSRVIDRWWADILFYGLATGTAYARIHNDRHWLSDTVLGAAIGYHAVQWVFDSDKNKGKGKNSAMAIIPIIQPYTIGMMITF